MKPSLKMSQNFRLKLPNIDCFKTVQNFSLKVLSNIFPEIELLTKLMQRKNISQTDQVSAQQLFNTPYY